MLRKEQIDVVHVCTPSGAHMDPAIMAMQAGKNVKALVVVGNPVDEIKKVAENEEFDVIHAHDWMTFPAGIAVARNEFFQDETSDGEG